MAAPRTLGINGLGRIGKLTLWYHLAHDDFDTIVVNVGRPVGTSLQSVLEYCSKDSTYGSLHRWLGGCYGKRELEVVDEEKGLCKIQGKNVIFLRPRPQRHPLA
jgi:glyceraldehyde 3-phosphate dehydrogenase